VAELRSGVSWMWCVSSSSECWKSEWLLTPGAAAAAAPSRGMTLQHCGQRPAGRAIAAPKAAQKGLSCAPGILLLRCRELRRTREGQQARGVISKERVREARPR
jgi:hypothetical protein